jgi:hypothetical protein
MMLYYIKMNEENETIKIMKKNKLPIVGKIQDVNDEFNKAFRDEVFMPMVTFAVTILFVAVILDYGFQLINAIDILTL